MVFAIGQRPDIDVNFGLELRRGNLIAVENDCETSVKGVFAAGDAVTGTTSIIEAIAGARRAAAAIDVFLGGDGNIDEKLAPEQTRSPYIGRVDNFGGLPRTESRVLPPQERCDNFEAMDLGLDDNGSACESGRCLQCDLRLDIAPQRFWTSFFTV